MWRKMIAIILLLSVALPALAELTKEDVVQIIRTELEPIKLDIAEMKGKMATKDDIIAVQREVSSKFVAIIAALTVFWATLLAAIITIPYLYGRADRERVRQLEAAEETRREKARRLAQERPEFEEAYKAVGLI